MEYNGELYGFSAVKVKLVDSLICKQTINNTLLTKSRSSIWQLHHQAKICGPTDRSISAMPENTISPPPADLQSDTAVLRKAVSRIAKMQAQDPADPMKFAQVKERQLLKAMKSPRKRKALPRSGISVGKHKSKEVSRLKSALAKVKSYVYEPKTSNTKSSRLKKRTLARALRGTTPKMWLSTQTGLSRAFMLKIEIVKFYN